MKSYLVRRSVHSLLTLFGISLAVFLLLRIIPGDPARLLLPEGASEEQVQKLQELLGLSQPLHVQYVIFLRDALQGEFGHSYQYDEPALRVVLEKLPATIELSAYALLLAVIIALPLGILSAVKRNTFLDYSGMIITFLGQSMPSFWLGIMLILIFSVGLKVLPTSGRGTLSHIILPAITLGTFQMALIARLTRSSLLEVLGQDFIRTAQSKGLPQRVTVLRHALKNALIPVVTVVGLQFGALLGGAVITETIFSWPGIGKLVIDAIFIRDYPIVQAVLVVSGGLFVVINFLIDLSYLYLDPRIRYS